MWISLELQHKTVFQEVWELGAQSPTCPKYISLQSPELRSSVLLVRCHLPTVPHFTDKRTELPISRTCSVDSEAQTVRYRAALCHPPEHSVGGQKAASGLEGCVPLLPPTTARVRITCLSIITGHEWSFSRAKDLSPT